MKYSDLVLTIMAFTLLWIAIEMCRIEDGLLDFRPVRTYYQNFDVANCKNISITEEPVLARPEDMAITPFPEDLK